MKNGLYQYIREQEHRQDMIGRLGRLMLIEPSVHPDPSSQAFRFASREFEVCDGWTRADAIDKLSSRKMINDLFTKEPRLKILVDDALTVRANRGYSFTETYSQFKKRAEELVGYYADDKEMCAREYYDEVIYVLAFILPPDIYMAYDEETLDAFDLDI